MYLLLFFGDGNIFFYIYIIKYGSGDLDWTQKNKQTKKTYREKLGKRQ